MAAKDWEESKKDWEEFNKACEESRRKYDPKLNPTEANILVKRIMTNYETEEEYYTVRSDALAFLKSDASLEDKRYVRGHLESINMMISAIEEGVLHLPKRG